MSKPQGNNYWVSRFSIEIAVALTALEWGDDDLALSGLKECLNKFLDSPDASQELLDYLDTIQREQKVRRQAANIAVAPGEGKPSIDEIASRL